MIAHGTTIAVLAAPATVTANGNVTGVDVSKFESIALISAIAEPTAGTLSIKLQDSDDNTNFTDVPGMVFQTLNTTTKTSTLKVNSDRFKKYVRVVDTVGGTTPSATRTVIMVGVPKESQ